MFAVYIAPQREAGRAGVGKGNVHVAVFVEVGYREAAVRGERRVGIEGGLLESALTPVGINRRRACGVCHE